MKDESEKGKKNLDPKKELGKVLDEIEETGGEIEAKGRESTKAGRSMSDLARATKAALPHLPPNVDIEFLYDDLSLYRDQGLTVLKGLHEIPLEPLSSTGSTAHVSVSGSFVPEDILPYTPPPLRDEALGAITLVHQVIGRAAETAEVEELLLSLGFDKAAKGKKSPLELFRTANSAYEAPVKEGTPASTSLIPLRECIRLVIDELLKRRSTQEKTRNERNKILSIGTQLKIDAIQLENIRSWAHQWEELLGKDLSSAKDQAMPREEWRRRLQRATLFLRAFLTGLDPQKMRLK